jgi:DNA primase
VEQIFASADILEVVGDFVQLKRRGSNYVGLSPFKKERTPSFNVSPSRGIFKDFSSGKGGNAVTFLMELEGMTYVQALKYLAQKYGIAWDFDSGSEDDGLAANRREALLALNKYAAKWFQEQLHNTEEGRQRALAYFEGRGFDGPTLQLFQLGYSPEGWEAFTQAATQRGYAEADLQELGLSILSEKTGRPYDRYRSRAIFPLHDHSGRIIGFAGRVLGNLKDVAKYVNSPESVLYHKSAFLFGLFFAKQAIREEKHALLVEGYTDVISLYQAGVKNVVASSGTALTEQQIDLLRRFTERLTVIYDGDEAGVKASLRGIDLLVGAGLHVNLLPLPPEHDPDSFVREHGAAGFRRYAEEHQQDFLTFKLKAVQEGRPLTDPQVQTQLVAAAADTLARMPDAVQQGVYVQHAARYIGLAENLVLMAVQRVQEQEERQAANRQRRDEERTARAEATALVQAPILVNDLTQGFQQQVVAARHKPARTPAQAAEEELLRLVLNYYETTVDEDGTPVRVLDKLYNELHDYPFTSPKLEIIRRAVFDAYEFGRDLPLNTLIIESDEAVKQEVLRLMMPPEEPSEHWAEHDVRRPLPDENLALSVLSALHYFKLQRLETLLLENRQRMATTTDPLEQRAYLETQQQLDALRRQLATEAGNVVAPRGRFTSL